MTFPKSARRVRFAGLTAVLLAVGMADVQAMSLQQAYAAALKNDPTYRMNFYENEAAKENRVLGRSNLLPSVAASWSGSKNNVDQVTHVGTRDIPDSPKYVSRSAVIQLRQPLFNLDAWARYRQGVAQSNEGEARFEANTGEVALRVVGAYVDTLFAADQVELATAQRNALTEQMKVNNRLFAKGEGTKTDMLETQARMDVAEAQLIEAQDNLTAARNTLEGVVGMPVDSLDKLGSEFRLVGEDPLSYEHWKAVALERNPDLKSARFAVEAAAQEVSKANAGHFPRVDLVAAYSKGTAESINTYNQDTTNRSVGVQVNIPLYNGGAISASARQAVAGRERAKEDLEARTSKVLVELRKAHSQVVSSSAKLAALDKSVASGKLLVKATEQSVKGGVRINLDLLNAQQQLTATQRDLAQARYTYLIALLRLKAAAGVFSPDDVRQVAAYFH